MYVCEELKLNKFKHLRIPSKKEYFMRVGEVSLNGNNYTGEEKAEMIGNKIDEISKALELAKSEYQGYLKDKEKQNIE